MPKKKRMIGNILSKLRKELKLTQQELADLINVSQVVISEWETNKKNPTFDNVIKLSEVLKKDISFFIDTDSDNKETETQSEGEGESEKQPDLSYIKYATIEDIEKLKNARFPEKVFYLRVFGSASAGKLSYLADEESEVRKVKVHDIQLDDESRYMSREQIEKVYMIFNVVGDSRSPIKHHQNNL